MRFENFSRRDFIGTFSFGTAAFFAGVTASPSVERAAAALKGKVKITGIKTAVVQSNYTWNYVKIFTNAGLYGLGEAFCSPGVPALMKRFENSLIGQDPLNVEMIYNRLIQAAFSWHTGVSITAISGIEIALWDLAGKILETPCYNLLGGKHRDRIALYGDSGAPPSIESSAWRDYGQQISDTPFKYYKVDIDPVTRGMRLPRDPQNRKLSNEEVRTFVRVLESTKEGLRGNDLAVDCHGAYDTQDAIRLANAVEGLDLVFLEDPIPTPNADAYKKITDAVNVTICTGENLYARDGFKDFIVNQACDMIQIDIVKSGGLLESKKIADLADLWYIPACAHNLSSPVGSMASAHACAAMRDFDALEFKTSKPNWWDDVIINDGPLNKGGYIELTDVPGLGVELNDEVCRAHKHPDYPYFG